jgi:MSHA biogenesis protein MshK
VRELRRLAIAACALALLGAELADPTEPPGGPDLGPADPGEARPQGWMLQSLLVAPGRRLAVIDGAALREGDLLAGSRVLEISIDGVELDRAGERVRLRLVTPSVTREED